VGQTLFDQTERQNAWFRLDTALEELGRAAEAESEPSPDDEPDGAAGARAALTGLARRARGLRDDLATVAEQRQRSHVYWGETRATGTTLSASPIEVGDLVRRHIVTAGPTPIFTSATLAAAGDFTYQRARLGLDDPEACDELLVPSPFDYAKQALLYVPRDLPVPADDGFSIAAARNWERASSIVGFMTCVT
jgi:ATP-dependent DNA helicase DinG